MKNNIDTIREKITCAEEDYKRIEKAWVSAKEIKSRIASLLFLAKELHSAEEALKTHRT